MVVNYFSGLLTFNLVLHTVSHRELTKTKQSNKFQVSSITCTSVQTRKPLWRVADIRTKCGGNVGCEVFPPWLPSWVFMLTVIWHLVRWKDTLQKPPNFILYTKLVTLYSHYHALLRTCRFLKRYSVYNATSVIDSHDSSSLFLASAYISLFTVSARKTQIYGNWLSTFLTWSLQKF